MGEEIIYEKPLQEECGLVGIFNTKITDNLPKAVMAAGGVQHRGQQGTGLAVMSQNVLKTFKSDGLVRDVFTPSLVKRYNKPATWIIIHCRYGTDGSYLKQNLQPCVVKSPSGETVVLAHNGQFANIAGMRAQLKKKLPEGASDTYVFTYLLASSAGKDWDEKIYNTLQQASGSYNLLIGIGNTLYAIRDPIGMRPLVIGKTDTGWMVASETHAFDKVGVEVQREVQKGEVIKLNRRGIFQLNKTSKGHYHFCDFEWAYFSRPNSSLPTHDVNGNGKDWMSVNTFRERCGAILSKEQPVTKATFAVGLPDSGIAVATGYAGALNIPYRQLIIRDHFDPNGNQRLFMRDDEKEKIRKKILGKLSLIPDKSLWHNAVVILGDDSIVRGNVSKQITSAIFRLGAKEVHWIIGFPAVTHKCHLGVSMRTQDELIAYRHNADSKKIAAEIGATSIRYISHRGFLLARLQSGKITVPENEKELFLKNGGCGGCITGLYPVNNEGKSYFPFKHYNGTH